MRNIMAAASWPRRLASLYDNIQLAEEWIQGCSEYLQSTHPSLSQDELFKHFQDQFLYSDLSRSCTKGCLPTSEAVTSNRTKLYKLKGRCLLQVMSITDISNSALSLTEIHDQIKEDRQLDERRVNGAAPTDARTATSIQLLDLEEAKPKYTKGLLKLILSDGITSICAIEHKTVPLLHMFNTALGTKIVVTNPELRRGIILLSPQNTKVLNSHVDELDIDCDRVIEQTLKTRLDEAKAGSSRSTNTNTNAPATKKLRTRASATANTSSTRTSSNPATANTVSSDTNDSSRVPPPTSQILDLESVNQVNELHLSDFDWNEITVTSPASPADDSILVLDD